MAFGVDFVAEQEDRPRHLLWRISEDAEALADRAEQGRLLGLAMQGYTPDVGIAGQTPTPDLALDQQFARLSRELFDKARKAYEGDPRAAETELLELATRVRALVDAARAADQADPGQV